MSAAQDKVALAFSAASSPSICAGGETMRSLALWLIFGKVSMKDGRYAQNSKLADRKTVGM
jgi:hypothetical protein